MRSVSEVRDDASYESLISEHHFTYRTYAAPVGASHLDDLMSI